MQQNVFKVFAIIPALCYGLAEIDEFKDRFARKTAEELTQISSANALISSAVEAARQLLKKRR